MSEWDELFDWDEGNEEHVFRHGIKPHEVEEALLDSGRVPLSAYNRGGEKRRGLIGATEAGRIIFVVYTRRGGKIRPITANDATKAQKRRYGRRA